jgi:hypothetical protein
MPLGSRKNLGLQSMHILFTQVLQSWLQELIHALFISTNPIAQFKHILLLEHWAQLVEHRISHVFPLNPLLQEQALLTHFPAPEQRFLQETSLHKILELGHFNTPLNPGTVIVAPVNGHSKT